MKKILYTLLAGVIALSSCSKDTADVVVPQAESTTFTLAVDGAAARATSAVTPARYIMEVWSEDGLTAENVFETGVTATNHAEILATDGSAFTVTLDKTKAYTCLFWADDNATFNAASLKAISLNADKSVAEAYHAKVAVPKGRNPDVAVTLKRAVAKITLTETATVKTTDDIVLKLSNIYPTFDVLSGTATGTAAEWTRTFKPLATTGVISTLYFFAKTEKELSDLTFTYAAETAKTVSNIPVQQNFATNIKGEFSSMFAGTFSITADDAWTKPANDVEFPEKLKVGSFYYSDNTFSNTIDATKTCIGIVFIVNADGKTGKIVGLDEPIENWNSLWCPVGHLWWGENPASASTDEMNGIKNMEKIKTLDADYSEYPSFAWAKSKNFRQVDGINWYLPATKELCQLFAAMSGLKWVASGAGAGEINDWGNEGFMKTHSDYSDARTAFNNLLTIAGGTVMKEVDDPIYWSSTQSDTESAYGVSFTDGYTAGYAKNSMARVRVVSTFSRQLKQ